MRTESEAVSQDGDATKPSRSAPCLPQHTEESPPREEEARRAALAPTLGRGKEEEAGAGGEEEQREDYIQKCNYR